MRALQIIHDPHPQYPFFHLQNLYFINLGQIYLPADRALSLQQSRQDLIKNLLEFLGLRQDYTRYFAIITQPPFILCNRNFEIDKTQLNKYIKAQKN